MVIAADANLANKVTGRVMKLLSPFSRNCSIKLLLI